MTIARQKSTITFDPDHLGLIAAFVAVAESLSFAEASDMLHLTSSTVSRKVSRLEKALGMRLFHRTTRKVALSEAGNMYYGMCRGILDSLAEADMQMASMNLEPRGQLRVSVPVAFGHLHMSSAFVAYLERHTKVTLETCFTDRFVDLIGEDFDLSVRIGHLPDSSLIARKIANNERLLVVSPRYAERYGLPATPADLAHHECIRYNLYRAGGNVWQFKRGHNEESVKISGRYRCDNSEAVAAIVERGQGIGLVAGYVCHDRIRRGTLIPLLGDWQVVPESNVYLCYPSARMLSPKVRSFVDFMIRHFADKDWSSAGV